MIEPIHRNPGPQPGRRRFRFGLKSLLLAVALLGLIFGWIARAHRRAAQQEVLVAELARAGVHADLREPTGLGQYVKKRFPKRERWVRDQIGEGWLSRPTVFLCVNLEDQQVPYVVQGLRRMGTVREIHFWGQRLSDEGATALRRGLPGVNVVPRANPALHTYLRSRVGREQLAIEGAVLEASMAAAMLGILAMVAWPLVRRRRSRGGDR